MKKISKIILCFVSTFERHLQLNQYQDLFFEISYIRSKYVYFLFWLNFDFGFFYKTMTKGTEYLNNITRKSVFRPLSPARWHDKHTYLSTFGKPWVMGAIESLGCNWWKNMHQIDAYCHNFFRNTS